MTLWFFLLFYIALSSCNSDNDPSPTNPDLAKLKTDSVGSITKVSAKVYSTISSEGKSAVTANGIVWGLKPNPTTFDNTIPASGLGIGNFSTTITGLNTGTTYYVRTYATNSAGTAYSNQIVFETLAALPQVITTAFTGIASNSSSGGGDVKSDGGGHITARGVCWGTNANPTISDSKTTDGDGIGVFSSSINGLVFGTKYFIRAYATNSAGTAYGNIIVINFGVGPIVSDIDGNNYSTIILANGQTWMMENLKVSKYRNGDPIPTGLDNNQWEATTEGAFSVYRNDLDNNAIYGKLYNGYAVTDSRKVCPVGWHVPTDAEWSNLDNFLGPMTAGIKMKSLFSNWATLPTETTNECGFTGLRVAIVRRMALMI